MSAPPTRLDSLIHLACEGYMSSDEQDEIRDLYRELKDDLKGRRRKAVAADRRRCVALVRKFLAPPGAELSAEAEQLLTDIRNGTRP